MTPRRKTKIRLIAFIIVFACLVLTVMVPILYKNLGTKRVNVSPVFNQKMSHSLEVDNLLPEKVIHLDLKGAPPLVSYLREFFPFIKKLGATGVLIEYEDMFPYWGKLEEISARNAYTRSDIFEILNLTESHGLKVIPLVQVFGKFEFVLKLDSFKKFREVESYPEVLCPSHGEVGSLIHEMIDQVLELHSKVDHLHIGCDEVYYLGKCAKCTRVMVENSWTPDDLYLSHVKKVATYIKKKYPRVRPIMWSDIIDNVDLQLVRKYEIPNLVSQMIWNYKPGLKGTSHNMASAAKLFKSVWIASAFKGATGMGAVITDTYYHLKNHESWKNMVTVWQDSLHFDGIVLTGWQRYNHFAELCELLPVGVPSLASNLLFLSTKGLAIEEIPELTLNQLRCDSPIVFSPSDLPKVKIHNCTFPGFDVYRLIIEFFQFKPKAEKVWKEMMKRRLSIYNLAYEFSTPYYTEKFFNSFPLVETYHKINGLEEELTKALSKVYDEHTVNEWMSTHVTPEKVKWNALYNLRKGMLEQTVWPRRPLLRGADPLDSAFTEICSSYRNSGCGLLLI